MKLMKAGKVAKKVAVSTNLFVKTVFMPNIDNGQTVISAILDKYSVCANKYTLSPRSPSSILQRGVRTH